MLKRIFAIVGLWISISATHAEESILAGLDHFLAASENSSVLFEFFNETLELPAAWPHESYGGFASGGVSLGGSVLELISYADFDGPTRFSAIAFLPINHVPKVREQLEQQGARLGPNDPYAVTEDGETHVLWENFNIQSVSSADLRIFVCDYKSRDFLEENRSLARGKLKKFDGGPLGVLGLEEIQIGTPNVAKSLREWSKLGLKQLSTSKFSAPDGAIISLVKSSTDSILGITIRVRSLEAARSWLSSQGLLATEPDSFVKIDPNMVEGLSISLIQ